MYYAAIGAFFTIIVGLLSSAVTGEYIDIIVLITENILPKYTYIFSQINRIFIFVQFFKDNICGKVQ